MIFAVSIFVSNLYDQHLTSAFFRTGFPLRSKPAPKAGVMSTEYTMELSRNLWMYGGAVLLLAVSATLILGGMPSILLPLPAPLLLAGWTTFGGLRAVAARDRLAG